jgi:ribosome-associated protein
MFREKEYAERPNKTRLKVLKQQHHKLGKQLTELSMSQFEKIPMSAHLREAILLAKKFQKAALKRQLKYISGLMCEENVDEILMVLQQQNLPDQQEVAHFHQIEQWRDQLIAGDRKILNQLIQQFETIDRQYINQLIRNSVREKKFDKPPKSSRVLFRYLKSLEAGEQ